MTPAERAITHALELLAEMPADPRLAEARQFLFTAADLIARYVEGHDTDPAPPPSARAEQVTIPDGAA